MMMIERSVVERAMEALVGTAWGKHPDRKEARESIDDLRAALKQQDEPVWMHPWPPVRAQQDHPQGWALTQNSRRSLEAALAALGGDDTRVDLHLPEPRLHRSEPDLHRSEPQLHPSEPSLNRLEPGLEPRLNRFEPFLNRSEPPDGGDR